MMRSKGNALLKGTYVTNCELLLHSDRIIDNTFDGSAGRVKCLYPRKHRLFVAIGADCPCLVAAGYIELSKESTIKNWHISNCVIKIPQDWSRWKKWRFKKTNTFQECRFE